MSDELLERLDAGPTTIQAWANECYTDAAARIRALQSDNQAQAARIAELRALLRECWQACSPCAVPVPAWYVDLGCRIDKALRKEPDPSNILEKHRAKYGREG